jgi:hypothetical protein
VRLGEVAAGFAQETLEHGAASEQVELVARGFGIGGLGAKSFASGAEPVEPSGVFGAELLLEFFAEALRERGRFAVGRDGDLEIATVNDGAVIKMAVIDVVDGIAEDVAVIGFGKDSGIYFFQRSCRDDQEPVVEVDGLKGFGEPFDATIANKLSEIAIDFGGDDRDFGARFEQARNFGSGDDAATDDENAAVFEFKESGKQAHRSSTE